VKIAGIDTSGIDSMVTQLRLAAARTQGVSGAAEPEKASPKAEFADLLKASLDNLNESQQRAEQLGQAFALGDEKTHLSDVMIAMQKANIALHGAVQVRNRLVSAYHEIMNMQV
jgi:flagellar hook-basal body complex protein FliE